MGKNRNRAYTMLTLSIIMLFTFLFTTKIWLPDDREKRNSKSVQITQSSYIGDYKIVHTKATEDTIEVKLSTEEMGTKLDVVDGVPVFEKYDITVKERQKEPLDYIKLEYTEDNKRVLLFQITYTKKIEDLYFIEIKFNTTEKILVDYRALEHVSHISKKNNDYVTYIEKKQEVILLEKTLSDIELSENEQMDDIQKSAIEQAKADIQLRLDPLKKEVRDFDEQFKE